MGQLKMGFHYAFVLLAAGLSMANSACHFEQYINSTSQTPNTPYVRWMVNLFDPPASVCPGSANSHRRQGVLRITTPANATKVIIRLHQEGENCFASWHLAMDWTDGFSGYNAEIHTHGRDLFAYGRYPGPGPDARPSFIDHSEFVSRMTRSEMEITVWKVPSGNVVTHNNYVERVYPDCDPRKARYLNQNMFRIDDMKTRPVYLGLNRVVSGRRGREGTGLYYVCIEFET